MPLPPQGVPGSSSPPSEGPGRLRDPRETPGPSPDLSRRAPAPAPHSPEPPGPPSWIHVSVLTSPEVACHWPRPPVAMETAAEASFGRPSPTLACFFFRTLPRPPQPRPGKSGLAVANPSREERGGLGKRKRRLGLFRLWPSWLLAGAGLFRPSLVRARSCVEAAAMSIVGRIARRPST